MTTNPFFDYTNAPNEAHLTDDLTIEVIQMMGMDVYYLPRSIVNEDYFYSEDRHARFTSHHPIEAYVENVTESGGDGEVLSKFGIELRDQFTLVVSRTRFTQVVPQLKRPREGDLIYLPLTGSLLEIMFIEHENPFWQHGRLFAYKFTCELFRYNQEDLQTGLDEVDSVQVRLDNTDDTTNDKFAKNDQIQTEADSYIDFDENNPFGKI